MISLIPRMGQHSLRDRGRGNVTKAYMCLDLKLTFAWRLGRSIHALSWLHLLERRKLLKLGHNFL